MQTLSQYLVEAEHNHGHMCPGQILGVRMAMAGCRRIGIDEPKVGKRLIVYVEIDRCAADAINTVTGCRLGRRTLKFRDFGKLAATFLNTETGEAVRVVAVESSREVADRRYPDLQPRKARQMAAYRELQDAELFRFERVGIELDEADRPGHPLTRVTCEQCGEGINDRREIHVDGRILCRSCAGHAYYTFVESITE